MRYFEKIALNALKARQLAKSFGLIPEAGTPWKHALRELRKGKTPTDLGVVPPAVLDSAKKKGVEWGEEGHELGAIIAKNIKNNELKTFPPYKGEVGMGLLIDPKALVYAPGSPMMEISKGGNPVWQPHKTIHTHPRVLKNTMKEKGIEGYLTQDKVIDGQLKLYKDLGNKHLELENFMASGVDPKFNAAVQKNRLANPHLMAETNQLVSMAKNNTWPSRDTIKRNMLLRAKDPGVISEMEVFLNKRITRPSNLDLQSYEALQRPLGVGGGRIPHNILEPSSGQLSVTKLKPSGGKLQQEFRAKYGPKNIGEIDRAMQSGAGDDLIAKFGPDVVTDYKNLGDNPITYKPYTTYWNL